ncbi:hypothetical protein EV356DRAFT_339173 [Viridothelium virens]|uniref:F-box domain-containing protein n=1 Tax=Viridothelium virens TaxID=1048519 RepID=A0A6A6HK27_VIRVR|nr:hypothetical protein EV356DRAFT_339173 [Viridothelium virens]
MHFRFLDLPRELRDEVYANCLSTDRVATPKTYLDIERGTVMHDSQAPLPYPLNLRILYVNRQIYEEGNSIFHRPRLAEAVVNSPRTRDYCRCKCRSIDQDTLRHIAVSPTFVGLRILAVERREKERLHRCIN